MTELGIFLFVITLPASFVSYVIVIFGALIPGSFALPEWTHYVLNFLLFGLFPGGANALLIYLMLSDAVRPTSTDPALSLMLDERRPGPHGPG